MKKCCLNCAFCVAYFIRRHDFQQEIEILKPDQRKGDFSFLARMSGMPNKTLKCYLGYWNNVSLLTSTSPKLEELKNYLPCDKNHFYNYKNTGNKILSRLKKEIEEKTEKKNLKWTRIAAIAAIIGAIIVTCPFIIRIYKHLIH